MKKIKLTYVYVAAIFFSLGFLTNHLINRLLNKAYTGLEQFEKIQIDSDDFDLKKLHESFKQGGEESFQDFSMGASSLGIIERSEDEKNIYYKIPYTPEPGFRHDFNVEVEEGVLRLKERVQSNNNSALETKAEREFEIEMNIKKDEVKVEYLPNLIQLTLPKK